MKQEKLDAEFAQSLQNSGPVNPPSVARPAVLSAFDRLSGMRPSASSSVSSSFTPVTQTPSSRKLPWAKNSASVVKSEPRSMSSNIKREEQSRPHGMAPYSSSYHLNGIKNESSSSRKMPGGFADDSSTASDSDIEIIPPEAFHDNGRHVPRQNGPRTSTSGRTYGSNLSSEAQAAEEATLRGGEQTSANNALHMAMYGTQSVPTWKNSTLPPPNPPQSMPGSYPHPGIGVSNNTAYGTPQKYGNGAANFVYPSATLGGLSRNYGGMYPGYAGGDMQNGGLSLRHSLSNVSGSIFGAGLLDNPINIDQLDHSLGLGGGRQNDLTRGIFNRPYDARMGEQIDYIMNDPRKTNEEIKALLENIRSDEELPAEDREGTPEGLVYPLVSSICIIWTKSTNLT